MVSLSMLQWNALLEIVRRGDTSGLEEWLCSDRQLTGEMRAALADVLRDRRTRGRGRPPLHPVFGSIDREVADRLGRAAVHYWRLSDRFPGRIRGRKERILHALVKRHGTSPAKNVEVAMMMLENRIKAGRAKETERHNPRPGTATTFARSGRPGRAGGLSMLQWKELLEAVRRGDTSGLEEWLRSDCKLTGVVRAALADVLRDRRTRGRGRPKMR